MSRRGAGKPSPTDAVTAETAAAQSETGLGERCAQSLARELTDGPVMREVVQDGVPESGVSESGISNPGSTISEPRAPNAPAPLTGVGNGQPDEFGAVPVLPAATDPTSRITASIDDGAALPLTIDRPGLRLMPAALDPLAHERWWKRALYLLLAAGFLVGYLTFLTTYLAPAHGGINQNAYLVGGKFLAETGTNGIKPAEPYYYLGWMWNLAEKTLPDGTKEIWYYPKYPLGMNALYAGVLKAAQWKEGTWDAGNFWQLSKWKMGRWDEGKLWAFWVNPITLTLAMGAMFMLLRRVAGSYIGFLGMMMMASCQVALAYANHPLSHGPSLCAVTWGMYFVYRFWQTGSWWRGVLAGLLCGFAMTTRYTEGLLVIPIAAAMLSMVRYDARSTRWWAAGVWIVAAVTGVILVYRTSIPLDRWYTLAALAGVGLLVGAIPVLRGQLRRAANTKPEVADLGLQATSKLGAVRRRLGSRLGRVNWTAQFFHWLRIALAAALVWSTILLEIPGRASWEDNVSGIVAVVIFKSICLGAVVLLYVMPWTKPRRWLGTVWPALAWAVPVGILIAFNYKAIGSFSGYDSTNESTAFTWRTFSDKWDDTIQQIYDYSLFLIPPLALAGLVMMYRWSWRTALLITLWLIPGFALYTSYYYGKQRPGMWYLRFFLTIFPPMLIAAMWLLKSAFDGARARAIEHRPGEYLAGGQSRGSVAMPIGLGIFAFCSCAVGLSIAVPVMEREHAAAINLAFTCERVVNHVNGSAKVVDRKRVLPVVFAEGRTNPNAPLCNMLQWSVDADLYPSDGFTSRGDNWRGESDPNVPNPLQAARQDYMTKLLKGKTDKDMVAEQNRIMSQALDRGSRVFAVLQPGSVNQFKKFVTGSFQMKEPIEKWREPARVGFERSAGQLDPAARGNPPYPLRGAQTWHLYEITRKPPATAPATAPAITPLIAPTVAPTTAPATAPAAAAVPLVATPVAVPPPAAAQPSTQPIATPEPVAPTTTSTIAPATVPPAAPSTAPSATPTTAPSTAPAGSR